MSLGDADKGMGTNLTVADLGHEGIAVDQRPKVAWGDLPQIVADGRSRPFNRVLLFNPAAVLFKHDLPRCTYPLGIGYIAAVLVRHGYEVRIVDSFAEGFERPVGMDQAGNFLRYGMDMEEIAQEVRAFEPDVVGVSSIFSNQADNVHDILAVAKRVNPKIVTAIGGAHARYFPKACLNDLNLDWVFLGESELTFLNFMEALNGSGDLEDLNGVAFRSETGEVKVHQRLDLIGSKRKNDEGSWSELDQIPFPEWRLYDMEKYFRYKAYQSPYTVGKRVGQIYTSRGCSARCTFCTTTNFWGNRLRRRSPDDVVAEISELKDEYAIDEFHIQDDNVTNDMAHGKDLFRKLTKVGLPWATPQGTALWRMDEELLDLMKESGAYQVTFAIESGVQRVLEQLIKKPLDLSKTQRLIRYAGDIGLHVHGFFIIGMPPMFGNPGETIEEMHETFNYACDAGFHSASFFAATPIVGSALLSEAMRQSFIDPDTNLYRMSYKQGLLNVPGLWQGEQVAELAAQFNREFNDRSARQYESQRAWTDGKY